MRDWTVLVTVAQTETHSAITDGQARQILDTLGGGDSWIQYPPASGRGHGFETRWWQAGEDAGMVAIEATERFLGIAADVGLDVRTVLVHVSSAEDRLSETTIGVERRAGLSTEAGSWSVMLRAVAEAESARGFPRASLDRLLALLPGSESSGFSRDGMVEVRFWVEGKDAADSAGIGAKVFLAALMAIGCPDWTIVRAHVTSVAEAKRTAYLGVQQRVLAQDPTLLQIAIRI